MPTLSGERIRELITPFYADPGSGLVASLSVYLDLLLKWNVRTNLTAIREPEEIVTRHFGESLFASRHVGDPANLLDFGSGAGFPGIPIALACPALAVTLAESQHKKAAFLREAVRSLALSCTVFAGRVEDMPASSGFDCVAMRAVDSMERAVPAAASRVNRRLLVLTTAQLVDTIQLPAMFSAGPGIPIPGSEGRILLPIDKQP